MTFEEFIMAARNNGASDIHMTVDIGQEDIDLTTPYAQLEVGVIEETHLPCRLLLHRLRRELKVSRQDYRVDISLIGGLTLGSSLLTLNVALLTLLCLFFRVFGGCPCIANNTHANGEYNR